MENDLNSLLNEEQEIQVVTELPEVIPKLCQKCHNNTICKGLEQVIALYRLGIDLIVESCLYYAKGPKWLKILLEN